MKTRKLSNGKTDCKNMIFFSSIQINLMPSLLTFLPLKSLNSGIMRLEVFLSRQTANLRLCTITFCLIISQQIL